MARNFYGPNLTRVHHDDFGAVARAAAGTLVSALGVRDRQEGPVVDLGCGSGILARELSDRGFSVHGFDVSKEMLRLARKNAPRARFSEGSAHRATLPSCSAVTAIGEVLGYIGPKEKGPPALDATFRRIHQALRPGGIFLFDLAGPGRARGGYSKFVETERWSMHLEVAETGPRLTRAITLFTKASRGLYERTHEVHTLMLFRSTEVLDRLRAVGFKARPIKGYSGMPLSDGWSAFIARK